MDAAPSRSPNVFVHPQALCESRAVGDKTRIWAFAHVLPGAVIGRDCNIRDLCQDPGRRGARAAHTSDASVAYYGARRSRRST